jgi:uncharacterized protein YkwD
MIGMGTPADAATHTCGGLAATIVGTPGDDVLDGTAGVDVIVGLAGRDVIRGHGGNDVICGGPGPDRIFGGEGHDDIWGNGGNDRIKADLGRDEIRGGNGNDVVAGQAGSDVLFGDGGRDKVAGGRGDDQLSGGSGSDRLFGDGGDDIVHGDDDIDFCDREPADTVRTCELPEASNGPHESEMLRLINVERAQRGLGALSRHPDLDSYAADWAVEMSTIPLPLRSSRHHSPPFTGSDYPFRDLPDSVNWTAAFENVGYATTAPGESAESAIERLFYSPNGYGFMSSPGHKCNILETAAGQVGLGAYVDSQDRLWVVQVFWGTDWPLPGPVPECQSVVGR